MTSNDEKDHLWSREILGPDAAESDVVNLAGWMMIRDGISSSFKRLLEGESWSGQPGIYSLISTLSRKIDSM